MSKPNAAVTIRSATEADLWVIVEFNAAIAAETEDRVLAEEVLKRGVELALRDRHRCLYFVAETEGTVVGQTMVTFEWSDWRCAWFWWLQSVFVRPEHRGRGVFRALYAHIRDRCRALPDTCGLRLYAARDNRRAIETYLRLGMKRSDYEMIELEWSVARGAGDG